MKILELGEIFELNIEQKSVNTIENRDFGMQYQPNLWTGSLENFIR